MGGEWYTTIKFCGGVRQASCSPFLQPNFAIFRYPIADEPKTPCPVSDLTLLNSIPNSFQTYSRTDCINHTLAVIKYNGSKIKHTLQRRTATCHKGEYTSPGCQRYLDCVFYKTLSVFHVQFSDIRKLESLLLL